MFITLEGIEGSGKTSQIPEIVAFFREKGRTCIATREPGGTGIGKKIRSILLDPESRGLVSMAELLLYNADRVQHIDSVIRPHLEKGDIVLCDRFFDATLVYQGYARGLDLEMIRRLHLLTCGNMKPDLTLLLDLDPEIGLKRAWSDIDNGDRTGDESRFEEEKLDFHVRVRNGYLELAEIEPERFVIIDAAGERKQVSRRIKAILEKRI